MHFAITSQVWIKILFSYAAAVFGSDGWQAGLTLMALKRTGFPCFSAEHAQERLQLTFN
jgi:hypothetical protein